MTKKKVTPDVYALFTLMMAIIFLLMLLINLRNSREEKKANGGKS
jgi:ABC-type spermidine/putrescine transport system permease subunit II